MLFQLSPHFIALRDCASDSSVAQPALPGDVMRLGPGGQDRAEIKEFRLGAGVEPGGLDGDSAVASVAGTLLKEMEENSACHIWVESHSKWYSPSIGDQVVGVIEDKSGDYYRVNIRSGSLGMLGRLAFEGATKRNKPELKIGEPVYCHVIQAHCDLDTELTCVSASSSTKKEWSSGEAVFGPLPQGLILQVSLNFAKYLLQQENALLSALAKHFPFEVAVGVNGLVWLRASCASDAVVLRSAMLEADVRGFDDVQVQALAEVLARKHRHIDTSVK